MTGALRTKHEKALVTGGRAGGWAAP
eukprot:COSAG04_NODE_31476_length_256_cov_1.261146_1_plen_25_part_10